MKLEIFGTSWMRAIFNFCSSISLLFLGAGGILWAYSYFHRVELRHSTGRAQLEIIANAGVVVSRGYRSSSPEGIPTDSAWEFESPIRVSHYLADRKDPIEPANDFLGFGWRRFDATTFDGVVDSAFEFAFPLWSVVIITAALPGIRVIGLIRRRRRNHSGFCTSCGYNLTLNSSGVCPECGAACKAANQPV